MTTSTFLAATQRKIQEIAQGARGEITRLRENDRVKQDEQGSARVRNEIDALLSQKSDPQ